MAVATDTTSNRRRPLPSVEIGREVKPSSPAVPTTEPVSKTINDPRCDANHGERLQGFRRSRCARAPVRHTLATEILVAGGTLEDAADVLGNSPNIIRKHYGKWCKARQERISLLLGSIFGSGTGKGTSEIHGEIDSVSNSKQKTYSGGRHGIRTHDPHVANVVLSQLS
jgi:hypothetical protein